MNNQITTLFGKSHDDFLARLRRSTRKRAKRALVAKAIKGVTALVKIRGRELTVLLELRERLRDFDKALEDGVDAKLAKKILEAHDVRRK